jgi:hypothetical protein
VTVDEPAKLVSDAVPPLALVVVAPAAPEAIMTV